MILAAGRSTRMGSENKLLADLGGRPLVRRVAEAVLAADLAPAVVVLGHQADRVRRALDGLGVECVVNPDHERGLSTSLAAGIAAVGGRTDAALIALGDMPRVEPVDLRALADAFSPDAGREICVPVFGGVRGNPVLWGARYFPELLSLGGDVGARGLLSAHADRVHEVPVSGPGIFTDVDTAEALDSLRRGN